MSTDQYTSFYEEVQDKFFCELEGYHPYGLGEWYIKYKLTPKKIHRICPLCNCTKTYIHEYKNRVICGGTFNGVPVIYTLLQPRCKCTLCTETFVEEYEYLRSGYSIADEAEIFIKRMLGSMPMSLIANHLSLSVQTIANRAKEYAREERKVMLKGRYRYLSMDEVYIGRESDNSHRIYWVLNDNSLPWKSNNIMICIGRTKSEVIEYLRKLEHGDEVAAVSIDMWMAYKDAIHEALPNAEVVIDRFHVMKNAEEAINNARKNADCPNNIKVEMKKESSLFLKYWVKLTTDELDSLDYYLSFDKKLEETYYFVQEFMDFYNQRDYDSALEYLCKWESKLLSSNVIDTIRPFYDTILNWLPEIMNYFLFRITNGRTEGKNNLIRQINRMGFHYGLDCLQACIYSHDRNQEFTKWRRYQQKLKRRILKKNKTLNNRFVAEIGHTSTVAAA